MDMIKKRIKELGKTELTEVFESQKDFNFNVKDYLILEKLNLPDIYISFSTEYGFHQFNEDVVFKSIDKLPITEEDNLCPVDFIYGWGSGSNSLNEIRKTFIEQIPPEYFVFAEGNAGDQLCINIENEKVYYWHHDSSKNEIYFVSDNSPSFIESLRINEISELDDDIEEEWFADDF